MPGQTDSTRKPATPTKSLPQTQTTAPSTDPAGFAEETRLHNAANVLQLQRMIGNRATSRLLAGPITRSVSTAMIQRNPEEIAKLEQEIKDRQDRVVPAGNARKRNNAQIKKLQEKLEALRSTPPPVSTPELEAPKEPTYKEKYPGLAAAMEEDEIKALYDAVGEKGITGLQGKFSATDLKEMYTAFGAEGIKALPGQFGGDNAVTLVKELTAAKLKDLMSAYNETSIKNLLKQLGIDPLKDLMSEFSGAQLKTYIGAVGQQRFTTLVVTEKLKASALKKYTAAWLKTFVGANQSTMDHLVGIYQKNDGIISGGHDATVFYPFLDEVIGTYTSENDEGEEETYDNRRGRVTNSYMRPKYEKVFYTTHDDDGYDWASGSKTLIKNLSTQKVQWLKLANEAIWNAIRAETFDPADSAWAGTANDGTQLNGFYNKPKVAVDTFFPV